MRILKLLSLLFLISCVFACASEQPKQEDGQIVEFDSIFREDTTGLIRGSAMGDLPEDIVNSEHAEPVINSDTLVEYEYAFHLKTGNADARLYYTFDEFGLFEVQIDLYPETEDAAKALKLEIEKELTAKYGDSKELGSLKRWTTFSRSNSLVEITLSNESADFGKPFISLNYLEPLPDEI